MRRDKSLKQVAREKRAAAGMKPHPRYTEERNASIDTKEENVCAECEDSRSDMKQ